ncbi:MAG: hypothetical protein ABIR30_15310 [Chitinophagaceae bacterium]
MLKKLLLAAVLFTSIAGCKSKSAYNYSQDIVKKERSLTPDIEATERKVTNYVTAGQYDSIVVAAESMEKLVQKKIDEINALKVPSAKKAAEFKAATLKYFNYIKSIYTTYKLLGKAETDEKRQEVVADLQKIVDEKQTVINDMQTAQRAYADANGFKVEN